MINWLQTPVNAPILVCCFIAYMLSAAVTSYDIHLLEQYRKDEELSSVKILPRWIGFLHWAESIAFLLMLLLNWKFALAMWIIKSILKALFIMEFVGYIILYPFNLTRESFPEI